MTKALLNNLDCVIKNDFSYMDKNVKSGMVDFASVFNKLKNNEQSTSQSVNVSKNGTKNECSDSSDSNLKQNQNEIPEVQNLQVQFDNTIDEVNKIDEDLTNLFIDEEADEENSENIVAECVIPILTEDDETNEDLIMNNELNTLENPMLVAIINSQMQSKVSVIPENENEDIEKDVINFVKQNAEQAEKAIYKQVQDKIADSDEVIKLIKPEVKKSVENTKIQNIINEKMLEELDVEIVSSTESESSFGDLMQKQSAQEQTVKIMIHGDVKYDSVAAESVKAVEAKPVQYTGSKIIEQISKQLETMYNTSKLNMVLNSEKLGKINLQLLNSKEGLIAQMTVTTNDAKDALCRSLNLLRENLIAQGINVDNITVKLENLSDNKQTFDWKEQQDGSKGNFKQNNSKKQKNEEKPFEQMMFEIENNDNI